MSSILPGSTFYNYDAFNPVLPFDDILYIASVDNEGVDIHDLTDGAGHGILIATDNVYLSFDVLISSPSGVSVSVLVGSYLQCDLIYRFKNVSLQEYIGIVQSQQQ